MKQVTAFTILVTGLTACGNEGLGPQRYPLRLEATIGRPTIGVGDTTSLVFRLRNLGNDTISLGFPSSCQTLPYITTQHDQPVYPSSGFWGCLTIVTGLTLAPGAEKVVSVRIRGGAEAGMGATVLLLPGKYLAYARLEHADFPLRSATVAFSVH